MIIELKTDETAMVVFNARFVDEETITDAYKVVSNFDEMSIECGRYDGVEMWLEVDSIDIGYKQFTSLEEFKTWYADKNYNITLEAEIV